MAQNFKYSFDKSSVLSKITDYCKANKLKISDFEKNIGVSKGYLSRLGNAARDVSPSVDVVCKMANAIKVTPEELVNIEATSLSKTELYIESFFQKLLRRTCNNKIMWIPELPSALPINGFDIFEEYGHFWHNLLESIYDDDGERNGEQYIGKLEGCKQTIVDLILHTEFAEKQNIYIVPMKWDFKSGDSEVGFDIFLNRNLICSTRNITEILEHSVVSLYDAAKRSLSKHFLKEDARMIFEEIAAKYADDEESDDEDTIDTPADVNSSEEMDFEATEDLDFLGEGYISEEEICDYYDDSMSDEELFNDYDEDGTGLDLWAKHGMD